MYINTSGLRKNWEWTHNFYLGGKKTADKIRSNSDVLISIGIGGSYLGARAAIEFLSNPFDPSTVIFMGHHLSADYTKQLVEFIQDKDVYINIISKSGRTTEPAVAFRVIKDALKSKYSEDELKSRIIATTENNEDVLRTLTDLEGYASFEIPKDVGGRFSVFTPVGLLPIAAAGFDIDKLMQGARDMREICISSTDPNQNIALMYAAARVLLYQENKHTEILSSFEPYLQYVGEWWKQLFGESEGKENKGIYPTSANLTSDLHSLGQYMQEGHRFLFETFLTIDKPNNSIEVPFVEDDKDKLNWAAGKTIDDVNKQAYLGTKFAHADGDLPNMTISLPQRNEYYLGQLLYFFEYAVAISGGLIDVDPFNQPGVEAYKNNMFGLLGKPGYEEIGAELLKRIQGE